MKVVWNSTDHGGHCKGHPLIFAGLFPKPQHGKGLCAKIFSVSQEDWSSIGGRVKWLVEESGLSQAGFARRIGIGPDTLSKWVNNRFVRGPSKSNLRSISALFRTPHARLVEFVLNGGEPPALVPIEEHPGHHPRTFIASESGRRIPAGTIPIINRVPAGNGMAQTDQDFAANFSHDTVDAGPWSSPGSVAFFVHGDSMSPDFNDKDLVIADPNRAVSSGCFAIVQFGSERDDENKIRRVMTTDAGILLIPSNAKYKTELVPPEQISSLLRVVEHRRAIL